MRPLFLSAFLLVGLLLFSPDSFAQKESYDEDKGGGEQFDASTDSELPPVRDAIYDKISVKERKILDYDHLREADIFWQKRIWRVIDTKQKMNQAFGFPDRPLINVLLETIEDSTKNVRIFLDDNFEEELTMEDLTVGLGSVDTVLVVDPETYEETMEVVKNDFDWTSVTKFRVKEDWVFDEETSRMIVRILAVSPVRDVIDENGNYRGQQAMFYAYYPDFRQYLANEEVFSNYNDAQRMSWEDILEMRLFDSYIMKESNLQDRRIKDYATGTDALLESERIKNEIFNKEHNLWEY